MREVAIITGATSGFGKAIAQKLAQLGFDLIITGRRKELLEEVALEINNKYQVATLPLAFDIRSDEQLQDVFSNIPPEWKRWTVLINNAGLAVGRESIEQGMLDDWDRMIDTNIKGLLYCTRTFVRLMIENKKGTIVNIGSIAGKETYAGGNVYSATKFAVDALTKSMRVDFNPYGIRVGQVAPGAAETEFSLVRFKGDQNKAHQVYAGYTPLSADDVADAVAYIVSRPAHVSISGFSNHANRPSQFNFNSKRIMKNKVFLFAIVSVFALTGCHFGNVKADFIVHNACIYTMNENNDVYEAMAIRDGRIVGIGPEREIMNEFDADIIYDARKRPIYPGFIDGHCHFLAYGLMLFDADLVGATSFQEMIQRVVEYAPSRTSDWIIGRGWDQNDWEYTSFPTKDTLDMLFPTTPVYLSRIDGHAILVNSEALRICGITATTTIEGGIVEVLNGQCTGILVDNAMELVHQKMPERTRAEKERALLKAQENCFQVGLTTVDEAGLDWKDVALIDSLQKSGALQMRVYAMLSDNDENYRVYLNKGIDTSNIMLNVRSFKFYADGALGSRGACLLSPYEDLVGKSSNPNGMLLSSPEYFKSRAELIYDMGFQMNTHAIGDSANRVMLHIYKEVLKGQNDRRWRIEHAQVVSKEDMQLFKECSIIPSVQPTHATSDMPWAWQRLGRNRVGRAYIYKELLEENGMLALGTDFPVEGISPLRTFYAAVVRKDNQGQPEGGFQVENAIDRESALRGITIWNAVSNVEDAYKGSLEMGKVADFVLMSKDILKVGEEQLLEAEVMLTVIGGRVVFERKIF